MTHTDHRRSISTPVVRTPPRGFTTTTTAAATTTTSDTRYSSSYEALRQDLIHVSGGYSLQQPPTQPPDESSDSDVDVVSYQELRKSVRKSITEPVTPVHQRPSQDDSGCDSMTSSGSDVLTQAASVDMDVDALREQLRAAEAAVANERKKRKHLEDQLRHTSTSGGSGSTT